MHDDLTDLKVAFLVAPEGPEQVELTEPWDAVQKAGGRPELLSLHTGTIQAFNRLDKADTFTANRIVSTVSPDYYDGLVLPGGVANPNALRQSVAAVGFVADFVAQHKPVAASCHAPWLLIEADVVRGRRLTSHPSLATDLRNAGAIWVDAPVVANASLVTSRTPRDLPAFCTTLVAEIARPGDAVRHARLAEHDAVPGLPADR